MSNQTATPESYEAPAIEARHEIGAPLVGIAGSIPPP
jgi:hypothetical protein